MQIGKYAAELVSTSFAGYVIFFIASRVILQSSKTKPPEHPDLSGF